jgi:hypothetical protein
MTQEEVRKLFDDAIAEMKIYYKAMQAKNHLLVDYDDFRANAEALETLFQSTPFGQFPVNPAPVDLKYRSVDWPIWFAYRAVEAIGYAARTNEGEGTTFAIAVMPFRKILDWDRAKPVFATPNQRWSERLQVQFASSLRHNGFYGEWFVELSLREKPLLWMNALGTGGREFEFRLDDTLELVDTADYVFVESTDTWLLVSEEHTYRWNRIQELRITRGRLEADLRGLDAEIESELGVIRHQDTQGKNAH